MPVNSTHKLYAAMLPLWRRCRDVLAGEDAVRAGGTRYLPAFSHNPEDLNAKKRAEQAYADYSLRPAFYNAMGRTREALAGLLMLKEPVVQANSLKDFLLDVDTNGTSFSMFLDNALREHLGIGRGGFLVDYPQGDGRPISIAEANRLGRRPYWAWYDAEAIINWREQRMGGKCVTALVVLREVLENVDPTDFFQTDDSVRYRVLRLDEGKYTQSIYDDDDNLISGPFTPLVNNLPLDFIPFYQLPAKQEQPPLQDLVNVNLAHWRVSADKYWAMHWTALPTPWVSGVAKDEAPKAIGPTEMTVLENPEAKIGFLEFSGQGIAAMTTELEQLEKRMASLGARMLQPVEAGSGETATSVLQRNAGETSMLARMATMDSDVFSDALKLTARWQGTPDEKATVTINRDFMQGNINPQLLTALFQMVQGGSLSNESLWALLQRGDLVPADKAWDKEKMVIDSETPALNPDDVLAAVQGGLNQQQAA